MLQGVDTSSDRTPLTRMLPRVIGGPTWDRGRLLMAASRFWPYLGNRVSASSTAELRTHDLVGNLCASKPIANLTYKSFELSIMGQAKSYERFSLVGDGEDDVVA
jgi:hypothetical protein